MNLVVGVWGKISNRIAGICSGVLVRPRRRACEPIGDAITLGVRNGGPTNRQRGRRGGNGYGRRGERLLRLVALRRAVRGAEVVDAVAKREDLQT